MNKLNAKSVSDNIKTKPAITKDFVIRVHP